MRAERAYSPAARASVAPDPSRVLIIGCGALARELVAVIDQAGLSNVDLTCLPATLHNRPGGIPAAVRAKVRAARPRYERIFIAYADCGTGGLLDRMLEDEGVERLPGAHCYELYAGAANFAAITDADPATFFLTDFLARNFDRLVITGLGLDRHPELLPLYFGNYHRLVYLAQTDDPALVTAARRAARRLGLAFELRRTGYGELGSGVIAAATSSGATTSLAAGANNRTVGSAGAPETVDLLRPEQEAGLLGPASGEMSRQVQGTRPSRPVSRRCLRRVQRGGESLHGSQHPGTSAGAP
ncbi:MAG: hypothetical protein QOJ75_1605 [Chloroflexota bacterium]|jgi:hypothetical protein|nr:hypothetical protein [Chloroflexota bacterium]